MTCGGIVGLVWGMEENGVAHMHGSVLSLVEK
jgi:hypothetical protein